jgi:molybdopterin-containing oxidoreductase family membrane subunit
MQARLTRLLAIFVATAAYFVLVYHLTNLYFAKYGSLERFLLIEGGVYTTLFWFGQIVLGSLVPLALLLHPRTSASRAMLVLSALLVILGGLAQMYVTIIGSQAYPLVLFPGYQVSSSFGDGAVASYTPSLPEFLLGMGGVGVVGVMVLVAIKFLGFLPARMDVLRDDSEAPAALAASH